MLPLTSQTPVLLLLAAAALLGGGALALITGDARALGPLALGALGGWCAAQALTWRVAPATPAANVAAGQPPAAGPALAEAPRAAANGHGTATGAPAAPVGKAANGAHVSPLPTASEAEARIPAAVAGRIAPAPEHDQAAAGLPTDRTPEPLAAIAGPSGADSAPEQDQATAAPADESPAPLPVDSRLQDLAARQRTGTAELRRSIRDVIERLEEEEVPVEPPRRSRRRKR